jgi:hypothetical protein
LVVKFFLSLLSQRREPTPTFSSLLILDNDLDTAVLRAPARVIRTIGIGVWSYGIPLAEAFGRKSLTAHSMVFESQGNCLGSTLREPLVKGLTPDRIRVAFDRDRPPTCGTIEHLGNVMRLPTGLAGQRGLGELKQHVWQVDHDSTLRLAGVEVTVLEFFEQFPIAR